MTMQEERLGVGAYLKKCMHQGLEVFKHPMMLLPTLVLGAIWLVIGYLSSTTELPGWAKVVSFLSFAEGGLFGGALGAAGGIVGKVVVAVFINSAILPLFQKKLPFVGVAGGIKGMFSNMGEQVVRGIAPFLGGMGAALLLYSFMNISHVQINAFVGVAAVVLLLQNIGNQGGFLFGLLFSFANSITKGRVPRFITITRMLTGMTVGFTVAVGLSMAGVKWSILLGLPILLLAILLALVLNRKKAA
jgi:hypothetical protein